MYKYRLLEELELKYDNRFNMFPEYHLRCLGYCLELLLNYETLSKQKQALYLRLSQKIHDLLRSKLMIEMDDVSLIYVQEGWNLIKNNIDRLKQELYSK